MFCKGELLTLRIAYMNFNFDSRTCSPIRIHHSALQKPQAAANGELFCACRKGTYTVRISHDSVLSCGHKLEEKGQIAKGDFELRDCTGESSCIRQLLSSSILHRSVRLRCLLTYQFCLSGVLYFETLEVQSRGTLDRLQALRILAL